ncbi:MAG: Uma2 family endonuclease [Candidatus Kapaibacterium sp.]
MVAQLLHKRQNFTYADYAQIDDDLRRELIHGELLMAPAPGTFHQSLATKLTMRIAWHVEKKNLGVVFAAPTDVILSQENTVQPDILFISKDRKDVIQPHAIVGSPDLIVEIISPGSIERDRYVKRDLYEQAGVREYWMVDPANRSVEVLVIEEGEYRLASFASQGERVVSTVVEGLKISLDEIMPNDKSSGDRVNEES